ncbi:MAG: glutamate racemase [Lachnospiraceae bacterium]
MKKRDDIIAVFDSGMGGISVLRELYKIMPEENYLFYGDSLHAPYGTKTKEEVCDLTFEHVRYFVEQCHAKAVMVACNTATSAAVRDLRKAYPDLAVVGLEPALKPAVLAKEHPRVLVMATPLTLREEKFARLMERYRNQADIFSLPAPRLVELVEQDEMNTPKMREYLWEILKPYIEEPVDSIVLGCTHFPFASEAIRAVYREAGKGDRIPVLYDGGEGAARYMRYLLNEQDLRRYPKECYHEDTLEPRRVYPDGKIVFENSDPTGHHQTLSKKLFRNV